MNVDFVKTTVPCLCDKVICWHAAHGWIWNVLIDGVPAGVFYCTLLCGDGVVVHFSTLPGRAIPAQAIRKAFEKGIRITAPLGAVFATIPAEKKSLIKLVKHMGFRETNGNFSRPDDGKILLLQYFPHQHDKL